MSPTTEPKNLPQVEMSLNDLNKSVLATEEAIRTLHSRLYTVLQPEVPDITVDVLGKTVMSEPVSVAQKISYHAGAIKNLHGKIKDIISRLEV